MPIEGPWYERSEKNDYLYNGKEYNTDLGLNMNDYGARWYDPATARWSSVDPLAEKYVGHSGYNYVLGNPVKYIDPDGQRVFLVVYTGGSSDAYDAAKTRQYQIENSGNFNPAVDNVYFLEINDLGKLKTAIESSVAHAQKNGFGKTVEFSTFGHGAPDGPAGSIPSSQGNLADVTNFRGARGDQKQVTPSYWKSINFNFDGDKSFASFYGCNTADFAPKFLVYQPYVTYAAGLSGGAGGSLNETGNFVSNWLNLFNRKTYLVTTPFGNKIGANYVYDRCEEPSMFFKDIEGNRIPSLRGFEIEGNLSIEKF